MPVASARQPVWNEGAARGLICLTAFGPSAWASAGRAKRAFSRLEIGTKKEIFLENVKSAV